MSKKKGKGHPPLPGINVHQKASRVLAAKEKSITIVQRHPTPVVLPEWNIIQFAEFINALPEEKRATFAGFLDELADFGKIMCDITERHDRALSTLVSREDSLNDKQKEFEKKIEEIEQLESLVTTKEQELKDLERDLTVRELDARTGFASQNASALSALKNDIKVLEAKRDQLYLEIQKAEEKAKENYDALNAKLQERETAIVRQERANTLAKRELDIEWQDLERDRQQFRDEAQVEAQKEIDYIKEAKERAENRAERAYAACMEAEKKTEQFRELEEVLSGRSARELLDEFSALKREVRTLENRLSDSHDDQLQAENEELRKIRDSLKDQLDDLYPELAEVKSQLHRLRLGVSDQENLEKEKRALQKNNQILSARLNDLGKTVDDLTNAQQAEKPFPQLSWMDTATMSDWKRERDARELAVAEQDVPNLKTFAEDLQHRIAEAETGTELYYRSVDIQLLLAGLAMSQLHIFQGMSGTGKTSLAKAFAKAVGGPCTDIAVQAGWRDRDDLLGHYNAFEKRFYEKDCLQGLYKAQTLTYENRCNIILLDEINLSRPEQYFAEFLSALEKNDPKDRMISLSENRLPNPPSLLVEGRKIRVPRNVWFIGTANHDETTNEFADKTYDRAHVMTLPRHEASFTVEKQPRAAFAFDSLMKRFDEAIEKYKGDVKDLLEELTTGSITEELQVRFDLGWGNRFERQALRFIPVFMASGGKKEDGLDHLLASRIFRRGKVTGRYDATIDDLAAIEQVVKSIWKKWNAEPLQCLTLLTEDRYRKERRK